MTQSDIGIVEKACPFCKHSGSISDGGNGLHFRVICDNGGCRAAGPLERCAIDAKEAWNTRDPIITEMVEALEDARNNILSLLGGFEEDMPEIGVKLFQAQAKQIDTLLAKVREPAPNGKDADA